MLENGTASRDDIDTAMKGGCNFPMGPLALLDLVGLDTSLAILDALYDEFRDPNYAAVPGSAPHGHRRPPRPEVRPGLLRLLETPDWWGERLHRARRTGSHAGRSAEADDSQLRHIFGLVARSAREAGAKAVTSGQWLAEVTLELAGHLNVRDLATLREHHDGLAGPLLARVLIRNASLTSAMAGAATGALAAASEATPATWGTLPIELLVETLVVVGIEMKLVAELHEAAGIALPQSLSDKATLIARSWAESRGVRRDDVVLLAQAAGAGATAPIAGAAAGLLGRSGHDQLISHLRRRLIRHAGRTRCRSRPC